MESSNIQNFNKNCIQPVLSSLESYDVAVRKNQKSDDKSDVENVASRIAKDVPITVVIGGQSTGKTSMLNRIIGHSILYMDTNRATTCLFWIKIRANNTVKNNHQKIIIKLDDEIVKESVLNLKNKTDSDAIGKFLESQMKLLDERNPDTVFHDSTISIEIQSSQIKSSFDLLDMPGLIDVDTTSKHVNANSLSEIKELVKKTCQERNTNYLILSDVRRNFDNSAGIAFFKDMDLDKSLSRTKFVLSRCDGVLNDEKEKERFLNILKNGSENGYIKPEKIIPVVNRIDNGELFTDEGELNWWNSKLSGEDLILSNGKLGVQNLRNIIVRESTKVLAEVTLPKIVETLKPEREKLKAKILKFTEQVNVIQKEPFAVIRDIENDLRFLASQVSEIIDDSELSSFKENIMEFYSSKLIENLEDVRKRIVKDSFEIFDDDKGTETSLIEEFMKSNKLATNSVKGDDKVYEPLFNITCTTWIGKIGKDSKRIELLNDFMSLMKQSLLYIQEKHTEHNPRLRTVVSAVFNEKLEEMKNEFLNFINEKIFTWYTTVVPYKLLTKEELLTRTYYEDDDEEKEDPKPITSIEFAYAPFSKQCEIYLNDFIDKLTVDTQTAMRCDMVTKLIKILGDNLAVRLNADMSKNKWSADDYKKSDAHLKIEENLKNTQEEEANLTKLIEEVDGAIIKFKNLKT